MFLTILASQAAEKNSSNNIAFWGVGVVTLLLLFAFIAFCVFMLIGTSRASAQRKREKRTLAAQGIQVVGTFGHISGLPVAPRNPCQIMIAPQGYIFKYAATTYQLPFEKVRDVAVHVDKEKHIDPYRSVVDGNVKVDVQKTTSYTLDFVYENNGVIKQILFSCPSWSSGDPLVKAFYDRQAPQNITL